MIVYLLRRGKKLRNGTLQFSALPVSLAGVFLKLKDKAESKKKFHLFSCGSELVFKC